MRELNILEMVKGMNGESIEFRDDPNKPGKCKSFKELLPFLPILCGTIIMSEIFKVKLNRLMIG